MTILSPASAIKWQVPFNKPRISTKEHEYVTQALAGGGLAGDGEFTRKCHKQLTNITGCANVLLTHSCTAALEMAALLLDLQPGDEVIMPSYTFVSTANAVVLRGAVPVFIDIRADCFNLDERLIEAAITERSKAIYVVHYAGVSCDLDYIMALAGRYELKVIEDAAQGIGAVYKGRHLGTIGDFGALSFHATKNIQAGEGGALLINDPHYLAAAEIMREKGTNRKNFLRGEVDKYTWVGMGSSYLPADLIAAYLLAQLEDIDLITKARLALWHRYHDLLAELERKSYLRRPIIPSYADHNAHIYPILLPTTQQRDNLLTLFKQHGIQTAFHYIPLHATPAGIKYGKISSDMTITDQVAGCILRLPLFAGLQIAQQDKVIEVLQDFLVST